MPQAQANGLTIEYDVHGPADGEPVLLIMGLGAQMTRWPSGFIDRLAARVRPRGRISALLAPAAGKAYLAYLPVDWAHDRRLE